MLNSLENLINLDEKKIMKKIIVTGGAGFIGSNLVDRLIKDGNEVIIIDNLSTGKEENINSKAEFYNRDISNFYPVDFGIFEGVDTVFHLAAMARVQLSIENPLLYHNKNVNGLVNVLEASRLAGVKRFVFSSSSSVYGDTKQLPTLENSDLNPISPYALHKLVGEQYCQLYSRLYDIETVCLRYFNVYGERQLLEGAYCLVMGIFANQRMNGESMTINGDGNQERDFTYVGDVVQANINAATSIYVGKGEVINIGRGECKSVNQLADMIGGDRVYNSPVLEPRVTLADNTLARKLLDWTPKVNLEDWLPKYKKELGLC